MGYFKDAEECRNVLLSFLDDFSEENQRQILLAISLCDDNEPDRDKIFRMLYCFKNALWDKPEAVSMGFHKWMEVYFSERIGAMHYHNINGENKCVESIDT